jgi:1-deoxy-D-xylulose-5-phosphate synthase
MAMFLHPRMENSMATDPNKFPILSCIESPDDVKKLSTNEMLQLAKEAREFIIGIVAGSGGHLAPSLGVVELTIALHFVYNSPVDKIVWDVGHQAYIHKILTGRRDNFHTNRLHHGVSGFPRRIESPHDKFGVGHASTSISAGYGMVCARQATGADYKVVSIIGDGALTGGLAFEALNNAGDSKKDFTVVLNDNEMSISPNVGAISTYLTKVLAHPSYNKLRDDIWNLTGKLGEDLSSTVRKVARTLEEGLKASITPGVIFEEFGFRYFGPVDGHDLSLLIRLFTEIEKIRGPKLVHIITKKGKGYRVAEADAKVWHGVGSFDKKAGKMEKKASAPAYTNVFGELMEHFAEKHKDMVAITAAMSSGTGLDSFAKRYPERFYDVGIAEAHGVCFAAGLAAEGAKPVVAIYSTFLQRAYDQIIHDVALQRLPVFFCLDRAGLVGADGATHHGVFDISYLLPVPNFVLMAAKDEAEFVDMFYTGMAHSEGPIALRYPRGAGPGAEFDVQQGNVLPIGKAEILRQGETIAILAYGHMVHYAMNAAATLDEEGLSCTVVNLRFAKPLDEELLSDVFGKHRLVVSVEENQRIGGVGSFILATANRLDWLRDTVFHSLALGDAFIEQGTQKELHKEAGIDPGHIVNFVKEKSSVALTNSGI